MTSTNDEKSGSEKVVVTKSPPGFTNQAKKKVERPEKAAESAHVSVHTKKLKDEPLPSVLRDRVEHELASSERRFRSLPHGAPARRSLESVIAVLRRCLEADDA